MGREILTGTASIYQGSEATMEFFERLMASKELEISVARYESDSYEGEKLDYSLKLDITTKPYWTSWLLSVNQRNVPFATRSSSSASM